MDFIRDAGFGIWPVLGFGGWALVAAIRHATAPREGGLRTVAFLLALTAIAGVLGTVIGVQVSAEHMPEVGPDEKWIFLLGLRESLNNMVASLVLDTLSILALLVGHLRTPKSSAGVAAAKRRGVLPQT